LKGELIQTRHGTPGYRLVFEVAEGEYEGRRVWHELYLTDAALSMTKRDLQKLGITSPSQLERPLPAVLLVKAKIVLHRDDEGNERSKVRSFDFVGIEPGDAFEPTGDRTSEGAPDDPFRGGSTS
jgi:hypothetical protein